MGQSSEPASGQKRVGGRTRSSILARRLTGVDFCAAFIAGSAGAVISGAGWLAALVLGLSAAIAWPVAIFSLGLYTGAVYGGGELRSWISGVGETPWVLVAALVSSWPLFGVASALSLPHPFGAVVLTLGGTVLIGSFAKAAVRAAIHTSMPLRQRTLILGSGLVAERIIQKLQVHDEFGLDPIGIVDDEIQGGNHGEAPCLGRLADLGEVLAEHRVDRVVVAFSRASHQELLHCIRTCRDHGAAVDVVPRLFESLDGTGSLESVGGLPMLSIGAPRLARSSQRAKRVFDVTGSLLGLLVLSPFLVPIAIAIKLDSSGPILFRQPRMGRGGQEFQLVKFRSMCSNAEELKGALPNDLVDGVMFKLRRDPRVTRVGLALRRFSLDELPQLWNVVKGEMSLVGPRPLALSEAAAASEDWHRRRLDLRPGITGPWQVRGRSENPFQEMMRFDYEYVARWSLVRDIEILLATVPAVLSGRGAY